MTAIPNYPELPAQRNRPDLNKLPKHCLNTPGSAPDPLGEKSQEPRKRKQNKSNTRQRFVEGVCGVVWMEKEPLCPMTLGKLLFDAFHGWICSGSWRCGTAGACRAMQNFSGEDECHQTNVHRFPTLNPPYKLRSGGESLQSSL